MTAPITPGVVYKNRAQATDFYRERGVPMGNTSLAEMASEGRGPAYAVINGRALYVEHDLLAWLAEQAAQSPQASGRGRGRAAQAAA
jgi:hypothetical protein